MSLKRSRGCCSCWSYNKENEESDSDARQPPPRPHKRHRLDPVVKEAREKEEKAWKEGLKGGFLAMRIVSDPPSFAGSQQVVDCIDSIAFFKRSRRVESGYDYMFPLMDDSPTGIAIYAKLVEELSKFKEISMFEQLH
jgi:hypothetical protein